jgi:hypothetical protein
MTRNILGLRWGPEIVMLYKCRQKYCLKNKTELNFTVEDASERNRAWAAPVAQTRFPPSTPGATLCEETQGFVRFLTFKCHLDAAIPLRSAITALQIKHEHVSSYSNANCNPRSPDTLAQRIESSHWHSSKSTLPCVRGHPAQSRTRRTNTVPHIAAGTRFIRESFVRFLPSKQKQSDWDLQSITCKSHWNCVSQGIKHKHVSSYSNANCNPRSPTQWHVAVNQITW